MNESMPFENKNANQEVFNRGKVRFLSGLSFFIGFLDAFLLYILSSYFVSLSGESLVGFFYFFVYLAVLVILTYLQPILFRLGSVRLLLLLYIGLIACGFYLSLQGPTWTGAFVLLLFMIVSNTLGPVMDILLEDFSADQVSGRIRGFFLTVLNAGLLMAPFVSTWTLSQYGYQGVFAVLTAGYALLLMMATFGLRSHRSYSQERIAFLATLRTVFRRKNLLYIYAVSWVLELFYVVMIVYSPILLLAYGYSWTEIGIIFTVMLIPFVLIQYPLGVLADKHWGEKELLIAALIILSVTTAWVGIADQQSLVFWSLLLLATRVGAAGVEILRDSYFYKQITRVDTDIIAFFRTARPTANMVAAILGLLLLTVFPIQSLFFMVALGAAGACGAALLLKDSRERGVISAST